MVRWPILLPCFLLSAASAAVAGEFPFAARVQVLPSVTVRSTAGDASTAFRVSSPQDQCLNIAWRQDAARPGEPIAAVLRRDGSSPAVVDLPEGGGTWILAVTLE